MTIGACFFGFGRKKKNAQKEITLAIFGIDNAGKTTTTKSIRGESLEVCPTMGFNLIEFSLDSYNVSMYDIGGSSNLRSIWNNYFSEIHGLVYVVDSCDTDRLDETRSSLAALLQNELIQGKPVLLLANKQDSTEAMDEAEIVSSLRLSELACANRCPCRLERSVANIGTGAKMDKGIKTGLRWLLQYISLNWADLDARVQRDKAAKAAADAEEAAARKERVRRRREEREKQEAAEAATAAANDGGQPEGGASADAKVDGADGGDDLLGGKASRRAARRRQVDSAETRDNELEKHLSDVENEQRDSSSQRRNRRQRRSSSGGDAQRKSVEVEGGDGDNEAGVENEGDASERRRRSRRHQRRERGDSIEGASNTNEGEAVAEVEADDKSTHSSGHSDRKSKNSGKTGRRHRRLVPVDGDFEGDGNAATSVSTPTSLFEIGNSSSKRGGLPPLRGAHHQPNTDEVDPLT